MIEVKNEDWKSLIYRERHFKYPCHLRSMNNEKRMRKEMEFFTRVNKFEVRI
jgi:hypothetical protein